MESVNKTTKKLFIILRIQNNNIILNKMNYIQSFFQEFCCIEEDKEVIDRISKVKFRQRANTYNPKAKKELESHSSRSLVIDFE